MGEETNLEDQDEDRNGLNERVLCIAEEPNEIEQRRQCEEYRKDFRRVA